jgi:hypothetical protein
MDNYNVWADLFDTYQSTADWLKALWIVATPAFVLGVIAVLRPRRSKAEAEQGELLYSIRRHRDGMLTVHRHGAFTIMAPDARAAAHRRSALLASLPSRLTSDETAMPGALAGAAEEAPADEKGR